MHFGKNDFFETDQYMKNPYIAICLLPCITEKNNALLKIIVYVMSYCMHISYTSHYQTDTIHNVYNIINMYSVQNKKNSCEL